MKRTIDRGRKLLTFLSVLSILAVSVLSAFVGTNFAAVAQDSTDVEIWDGDISNISSVQFASGSGTAVDPYIIENGEQLYKMMYNSGTVEGSLIKEYDSISGSYVNHAGNPVTPAYYKLGRDIYLNDISLYDSWGKDSFDMSELNNWTKDQAGIAYRKFAGNFDGDGYYIYGLYAEGYYVASMFPNFIDCAVIKNVHFRNSYCLNTSGENALDYEGITDFPTPRDDGVKWDAGHETWYDANYGSAAVIAGCCDADIKVSNVSIRYANIKAGYFASAMFGSVNSNYPTIKNCLVADVTLTATSKQEHRNGVTAGIMNFPYGADDKALMEGIIVSGVTVFGANGRDSLWNAKKTPTINTSYLFKEVYSDVKHSFEVNHSSYGKLFFDDTEVSVVKPGYLKGERAKEMLNLDWVREIPTANGGTKTVGNWVVVDGDYPMPVNEYITPTGDEYYAEGGPSSSEDFWDGTKAHSFAAGTGTIEDPYLIENCEQFYLMASTLNADAYYKVADGVKALYFNNVKGLTYSETMNMLKSKKMYNYDPGESNNFSGYFDGNGVTIYGIKSNAKTRSAIIPQAGNATLKNFTVKNSSFNSDDGLEATKTKTEGSAAVVADLSDGATVSVRNVAVVDCYVHSTKGAAGFVACSHVSGNVFIDNCIVAGGEIMSEKGSVSHAGFVATSSSGAHAIKDSISLGIYPAADNLQSYSSKFNNVYTDFEAPSPFAGEAAVGVTIVETNRLKGTAVKETAPEFDWGNNWKAQSGIPMPRKHVSTLGTKGEAWSGNVADIYAAGDGSKTNQYQIDTAERLAQMLLYSEAGSYYVLTADIYLNDVSDPFWKDTAKQWFTSSDFDGFTGIFDGNGYTIYGLYNKDVASGVAAGLIASLASGGEVRNVRVEDVYLSGNEGAVLGAVVGEVKDNATNITTLRASQTGENVVIEGAANAGGLVGRVGYAKLRMDNSIFTGTINATGSTGGLVGEVTGKLEIKQSVSVGIKPFANTNNINASAIYTDAACDMDGVSVLDNSNMIGENAKTYMTELDFGQDGIWSTTREYPVPEYKVKSFNGVQGEVWTGEIANDFAGGAGTEDDPYQIATGEQLALAVTSNRGNGKLYYKMICDIYLNDVSDDLWAAKVGCNTWIHSDDLGGHAFSGHFDGDGYVVFGMYYNYTSTPKNSYLGLFPRIGGSMTIKNLGISQAYVKAAIGDESVYAGGIFGMGSAFYDFYGKKIGPSETVGDQFLVPGESEPTKLPSITNCFVDHTCYFEANAVGGIGCPGGAAVVIRDCIVTASIVGKDSTYAGGIIGNQWSMGSRFYDVISFPQTDNKFCVGGQQWIGSATSAHFATENCYYYGSMDIFGTIRVARPQWRIGEAAKEAMPELDWENTWRVEADGTPVLRVFDKDDRSGSLFSDKQYEIADVKINFMTGDSAITLEPLVGQPYSKITLPTISRQGYIFTGWYAFADLTLEYPYEYFLSRDINLYAGWKKNGIIQDFEDYLYSMYDCDLTRWNYNKPGSRGGYKVDYVHTGTKSMQLLNNSAEDADLLINYEEWLTPGEEYVISFWVATDAPSNATMSLVHNNHPDYLNTEVSSEPMVTLTGLAAGQWKQYSYTFTAKTNWISIRSTGNTSLYIDDVIISPKGSAVMGNENNYVNLNASSSVISPATADKAVSLMVLIATVVSCAVVVIIAKKNLVEIIEKN